MNSFRTHLLVEKRLFVLDSDITDHFLNTNLSKEIYSQYV